MSSSSSDVEMREEIELTEDNIIIDKVTTKIDLSKKKRIEPDINSKMKNLHLSKNN